MRLHIITALLFVAPLPMAGVLAAQDSTQAKQQRDTVQQSQQYNNSQQSSDDSAGALSDDAVLMRMHRINQMEIRAGHLAQKNSSNSKVKSFGARLVRDHSASDSKVTALAKTLGISLARGNEMDSTGMGREYGRSGRREGRYGQRYDSTQGRYNQSRDTSMQSNQGGMDSTRRNDTTYRQGNPPYSQNPQNQQNNQEGRYQRSDSAQGMDSTHRYSQGQGQYGERQGREDGQRLAQLHGAAFDTAFANMMVKGHDRAINMLEQAQNQVQHTELKSLIASTLPTLRQHLQIAESLQNPSTTTSSRQ